LQEIQTNCKNWIWKEKLVETSMCSHLGFLNVDIFKNIIILKS
jgi:hypothetical protein